MREVNRPKFRPLSPRRRTKSGATTALRNAAPRGSWTGGTTRAGASEMRVVLVLGGGGAKALAHAGAWRALQEQGAEIVHIVATSMGAVMGAAFAAGVSDSRVLEIAQSLKSRDVAALDRLALLRGIFARSILRPSALERTIAR